MNIRIIKTEPYLLRNLKDDKIVSVKIIKRDTDSALIDINGLRVRASLDAEVSDNFFALVERRTDEGGNPLVKLRVLDSLIDTKYFRDKKQGSLIENIKNILIERNLPLKESFFEAAQIIYKKGLKFEKDILKLVHMALIKDGPELAGIIADMIDSGLIIDEGFIEFFLNLTKILKLLYARQENLITKGNRDFINNENPKDTATMSWIVTLQQLFRLFFGNNGEYFISMFDNREVRLPVQCRVEENSKFNRFYFDFSSDLTGSFIIVCDCYDAFYSVKVYLDGGFLSRNKEILGQYSKNAGDTFGSSIKGKMVTVSFLPLYNKFLFWHRENERSSDAIPKELFNLDISA